MNIEAQRRALNFLARSQAIIDISVLVGVTIFFIHFLPKEVLNDLPATGGDMGSHFWPLYTLRNHALPNFQLRVWNPGNLGGEPHLLHYFPFAFLVMAFLSLFVPLGTAFNIGTILPLGLFPFSIYFCLRAMRFRFPIPIIAVLCTLPFTYNENYSMWGGNTLSTLAGQFSHVYALDLLMVSIGIFFIELRKKRFPIFSCLSFSLLATAHAYVFLCVPFIFLSSIVFTRRSQRLSNLRTSFLVGVLTLLLSAWYLVPMIDNQKWVTPLPMTWGRENTIKGVWVSIFFPVFLIFPIFLLTVPFSKRMRNLIRRFSHPTLFWTIPTLAYVAMYFIFPRIGLVDARTVPQVQLFVCILAGILLGLTLEALLGRLGQWIAVLPLCFLSLWWIEGEVKEFPSWSRWNYSGWQSKYLYRPLINLSEALRGELQDPRVLYEHNQISNGAGSTRVFEMLPYFANRATLESVYAEATILSPMVYYLQAKISETPSALFRDFKCPPRGQVDLLPKLQLMGVGDLILITEGSLKQARETDYYEEKEKYGPWHHFSLREKPGLVDSLKRTPQFVQREDWRPLFYDWFDKFTGKERYLLLSNNNEESFKEDIEKALDSEGQCSAGVTADFFGLTLETAYPDKFHVLKFAYHSSWRADSGAKLFLLSPGYIGLIPGANKVRLTFGQSFHWKASAWLSLLTLFLMVGFVLFRTFKEA